MSERHSNGKRNLQAFLWKYLWKHMCLSWGGRAVGLGPFPGILLFLEGRLILTAGLWYAQHFLIVHILSYSARGQSENAKPNQDRRFSPSMLNSFMLLRPSCWKTSPRQTKSSWTSFNDVFLSAHKSCVQTPFLKSPSLGADHCLSLTNEVVDSKAALAGSAPASDSHLNGFFAVRVALNMWLSRKNVIAGQK